MVETNDRRLPVGIQSFEEIRREGYLYVDKTDIIWQLANRGKKYNYLSRPRRFGKSVLVDTIEAYFLGKKELFEGLKIMDLETEWVKRPVIRLDMSRAGAEPKTLRSYLDLTFDRLEEEYGITPKPTAQLADRFDAIIQTACKQTGQQVAILIDEYDSPLQHSWKTHFWMPSFVIKRLQEGFKTFGKNAHGFLTNEAILIATETRTSSPVRIVRDRETLQHVRIQGLFPCGEGAGYAGGIVSAGVDGERCAEMCAKYMEQL